MDALDKETIGNGLKIACTVFTGLYAGGGMSILNSSVKAWRDLPAVEAIKYWKPAFYRNQAYQRRINLVSILTGVGGFACTYATSKEDYTWLVGAGLMLSLGPYTKICILPLNNQLLDTNSAIEKGDGWIRDSLEEWKVRHSVRAFISTALFGYMVYRLTKQ